jgi:hypothetical protein
MSAKATALPAHSEGVAGRAMRQISGIPPRVRPMKRLYMIQRCSMTRLRTLPARSRIPSAAAPTIVARSTRLRRRKRRVVTSAIAEMKPG